MRQTPAAFPGCAQGRPAEKPGPACTKKYPLGSPCLTLRGGYPALQRHRLGAGICRRPAVLWAHPLSDPQMLVHFYIPHNRTPCGRGLYQGSLTDSRGSHPHLFGLSGFAPLPSFRVLIIPQKSGFVKHFFQFF